MKKTIIVIPCLFFFAFALASQVQSASEKLEIISAKYGALGQWIDVTDHLREQVQQSTLSIRVGNEIAGDPASGVQKALFVEYTLNGRGETAQVREGSMLHIPAKPEESELLPVNTAEKLIELAKKCPADVGFYGINFSTGKTVEFQPDKPACLASIVKIFVLLEVMNQLDQGTLDLSEQIELKYDDKNQTCTISEALDKMIGISDNEATGALAGRVGFDNVNSLPGKLGITGLSEKILPSPGILEKTLDRRIFLKRNLSQSDLLPQHGTARGIVQYFKLLNENKLINAKINEKVLQVLEKNPKNFAAGAAPLDSKSFGKGGSVSWKRPFFKQYNMAGWAIMITSEKEAIAFCLWFEWFPEKMPDQQQDIWRNTISDSIAKTLLFRKQG